MAHASLQVCMDSNDWFQGTMSEEITSAGLDSSISSPSGGGTSECMLAAACSSRVGAAVMERRLRPPLDHNLKCPRCDSTHTKFCYYNNYSLSQPRYFCKTCRRYWTKGGTLRNIPVGGGCRKTNKKSSNSKKGNVIIDPHHHHHPCIISQGGGGLVSSNNANDHLQQLPFPEVQFPPHLAHLIGAQMSLGGGSFMDNGFLRPIDFMESKYDFMGRGNHNNNNNNIGHGGQEFGGIGDHHLAANYGNLGGVNTNSATSDFNQDGNLGISFMDQRMLLPFDGNDNQNGVDVKPSPNHNPKLISLEWQVQDQGCISSLGVGNGNGNAYNFNGNPNWTALMGGFQASTTNSLA